jgi:hypothetical protein
MKFKTYQIKQQFEQIDTSRIISSYELYLRFIDENNLEKEYDESYFDSKLLMGVFIANSNIENYGQVKNYYISQNKLIIEMEYLDSHTKEETNSVLFLFEYNNTILTDVNTIQLETDKVYELPINLDTEFDYCRSFLCNSRYNGKTFIIDSYEKYCEFYNEEQLNYKNIEMLNEDIFSKKSLKKTPWISSPAPFPPSLQNALWWQDISLLNACFTGSQVARRIYLATRCKGHVACA